MPNNFDAFGQAQIATGVYGACWLIEVEFASGTQYLCTWGNTLDTNGHIYLGVGHNVRIGNVNESEDGGGATLKFTATIANSALFASAIGPASEYRRKAVRLYLQLLTEKGVPVGAAKRRWHGYIDGMTIEREQPNSRAAKLGVSGRIIITASRAGASRSRRYEGLLISHAQQQIDFPGDLGYEYLASIIEKPVQWLSKRFQELA